MSDYTLGDPAAIKPVYDYKHNKHEGESYSWVEYSQYSMGEQGSHIIYSRYSVKDPAAMRVYVAE